MGWSSWRRSGCWAASPNGSCGCSACYLVVAPDAFLQSAAIDPNEVADRLSASYLIAVNALGPCQRWGRSPATPRTGRGLLTLTVDTVIGFRSPGDRAAFATDLQAALGACWSPATTTTTGDLTV